MHMPVAMFAAQQNYAVWCKFKICIFEGAIIACISAVYYLEHLNFFKV